MSKTLISILFSVKSEKIVTKLQLFRWILL